MRSTSSGLCDSDTIAGMERDLTTAFATVEEAIEDYRAGRFVVVVDAADRENEGDLTIAAQFATPRRSTSWRRTRAG